MKKESKKQVSEEKAVNLPDQRELEKEISDYLSRKYGDRVKIISGSFFPQAEADDNSPAWKTVTEEKEVYKTFSMKPEELVDFLDEYVIKQENAKAVLATKICTHFNRIRFLKEHRHENRRDIGRIKNNVLLIGPTGVGKTYLIKLIAKKIGVPFVKGDATKFSETGYVGGDVEDLVRDLVREAEGDIDKAQYGIIYVDEVDKIARSPHRVGADVSRSGVQRALLKPMEETEIELKVPHDIISQMEAVEHFRATGKRERKTINTKNILFIMSGAFTGLDEIIKKRCQRQSMGFEGTISSSKDTMSFLPKVMAEDLVAFGFESEFVGRLPIVAVLHLLKEEEFYQILINPNCPVVLSKKQDFRVYGINLTFTDEAYREIAKRAILEKTGARGLVSVVEKILLPFEKTMPSTDIKSLCISIAIVGDPERTLKELIESSAVQNQHVEQCERVAAIELDRLTDFVRKSRTVSLFSKKITITDAKIKLMALMCQEDNFEISDAGHILQKLVEHIEFWQAKISQECGVVVDLEEEAVDHILSKSQRRIEEIDEICKKLLVALEYGLRLITHKKHVEKVLIPVEGIEKPEQFINDLVEKTFKV